MSTSYARRQTHTVTYLLLTALLAASAPQRSLFDTTGFAAEPLLSSPVSVGRDTITTNNEDSENHTSKVKNLSPTQVIKTSRIQTNNIDAAGNQFQTTTVIKNDGNTETIERQVLELPTPVSIDGSEQLLSDDNDQLENQNSDTGTAIFLNIESSAAGLIDEPQNEKTEQNSDISASTPSTFVLEAQETEKGQLAIDENVLTQMVALVNALKSKSDVKGASNTLQTNASKHGKNTVLSKKDDDIEFRDSRTAQAEKDNTTVESPEAIQISAPKGEAHFFREESTVNGDLLESKLKLSADESSGLKGEVDKRKSTDSEAAKSLTKVSVQQSQTKEQTLAEEKSEIGIAEKNIQTPDNNKQPTIQKSQKASSTASVSTGALVSAAPRGEAHFDQKDSGHNWDEIASGTTTKKQQSHNWESSTKAKSLHGDAILDDTFITSSNSPTVTINTHNSKRGYNGESTQWPALMPYNFAFEVSDDETTNYQNRVEVVEDGVLRGSYSFLGADGVIRTVTYTDDGTSGFQIQTHEIPTDVIVVGSQDYKRGRENWSQSSKVTQGSVTTPLNTYQNQASFSADGTRRTSSVSSSNKPFSSIISGRKSSGEKETSNLSEDNISFKSSVSEGESTAAFESATSPGSAESTRQISKISQANIDFASSSSTAESAVTAGNKVSSVSSSTVGTVPFLQQGPVTSALGLHGSDTAISNEKQISSSSSIKAKSSSESAGSDSGSSSRFTNAKISSSSSKKIATAIASHSDSVDVPSSDRRDKISSDSTGESAIAAVSKKSGSSFSSRFSRQKQNSFVRNKFSSAQIELRDKHEEENRGGQSYTNEEESREGHGDENEEESHESERDENEEESHEGKGDSHEEESHEGKGDSHDEESQEGQGEENEEESHESQENNSRVEHSKEEKNKEADEDVSIDFDNVKEAHNVKNEFNTEQSKETKQLTSSVTFKTRIPSLKLSSFSKVDSLKDKASTILSSIRRGNSVSSSPASDDQDSDTTSSTSSSAAQFVSTGGSSAIEENSPVTFIFGSHSLSGDQLTQAIRNSQKIKQGRVSQSPSNLLSAIGPNTPITVVLGNNQAAGLSTQISHGLESSSQSSQLSLSGSGSAASTTGSTSISTSESGAESSSGAATVGSAKQVSSSIAKSTSSSGLTSSIGSSISTPVSEDSSVGLQSASSVSASSAGGKQVSNEVLSTPISGSVTSTSSETGGSFAILLSPVGSESSSSQSSGVDSSFTTGDKSIASQHSIAGSFGQSITSSSSNGSSAKSTGSSTKSSEIAHLNPLSVVSSASVPLAGSPPITAATNLASSSKTSSSSSSSSTKISSASGSQSEVGGHSLSKSVASSILSFFGGAPQSINKPVFILPRQQSPPNNQVVILPAIGGNIFKETGASAGSSLTSGSSNGVRGKISTTPVVIAHSGSQILPAQRSQSINRGSGILPSGFSSGIASIISQASSTPSRTSSQKSSTGSSSLQEFLAGGSSGSSKSSVLRLEPTSFREKQGVSTSSGGELQQISPISFGGGGRLGFGSNFNAFAQNAPLVRPQIRVLSQPSQGTVIAHGSTKQITTKGATGENGFSIVRANPGILRLERPINFAQTSSGAIDNIGHLVVDQGVFGLTPTGNPNQLFITANVGKQFGDSSSVSSLSRSQSSRISNFKPSITLEQSIARGLRPSVPASIAFGKTFPSVGTSTKGLDFGTSQI
ncbi:Insect cuticle protein [Trinorchestia longiramus]|nr:Insect cuticle protein [Trinorchestia longiramus]